MPSTRAAADTLPGKVPTGIPGFDDLTGGGLPRGRTTLLVGGPGRGKSTFIKSLLLGLAATRTPRDLNMYVFDFGSDGLKDIRDLPHIGAVIKPADAARVDQMIRMLRNFVNERTERLANYADLASYNAKNPNAILAEIVFVIDNFIEFKDNFEHVLPDLMTLVRDGRAFGVYFVITASTARDLPAGTNVRLSDWRG